MPLPKDRYQSVFPYSTVFFLVFSLSTLETSTFFPGTRSLTYGGILGLPNSLTYVETLVVFLVTGTVVELESCHSEHSLKTGDFGILPF